MLIKADEFPSGSETINKYQRTRNKRRKINRESERHRRVGRKKKRSITLGQRTADFAAQVTRCGVNDGTGDPGPPVGYAVPSVGANFCTPFTQRRSGENLRPISSDPSLRTARRVTPVVETVPLSGRSCLPSGRH
ncbi:hypothetical protein AVEN_207755-1 [Araneus ventricosus]|uniref:Uncharacterized protein n=1 Tax=Araneus ventricosus TaxID=182803 RepID=A0A4Y2BWX4_ARAVE|nr:hypothetical protein AVEN_207755-1 [Araneus ventricosus]